MPEFVFSRKRDGSFQLESCESPDANLVIPSEHEGRMEGDHGKERHAPSDPGLFSGYHVHGRVPGPGRALYPVLLGLESPWYH